MNDPMLQELTDQAEEAQQFRSQVGHISRQSGIFFAGTIFAVVLGYPFRVYLSRVLGPEAMGVYALGVTLIGFIGIFNTMGLPQSAVRFVASYRALGQFKELHALLWRGGGYLLAANMVLGCILLTFGRVLALRFYHAPALVGYLPLFALTMLLAVINTFYGRVLAGYGDLKTRTLITNFVGTPLSMTLAVLLISAGWGLRGYLAGQILGATIVCVMLLVAVQRFTPPPARFSAQPGTNPPKELWSFSSVVLGIGFLEFIVSQTDKVALGYFHSAREVGIYSVAAAVVVYVPLILSSVNQIFAPTIADLHARKEVGLLARLFQCLTKWVIGLTLPLALVIIIFARPVMRIFGHDFEMGWPVLVIGTFGQLVNCGVGSVGYLLLMSGNEARLMKVQVAMAVLMIVLSATLVPIWGGVGAAAAAATTNVGMNAWNLLEVRKALGFSPYNRGYFRLLPPVVAVVVTLLALKTYWRFFHHDWVGILVSLALAYSIFAAIVLLHGLDSDDRMIVTAVWARVSGVFSPSGMRS